MISTPMLAPVETETDSDEHDLAEGNKSPWTLTFDLSDPEHCGGSMQDILADLPDSVTEAIADAIPKDTTRWDREDLRKALQAAIDGVNEQIAALEELDQDTSSLEDLECDLDDALGHNRAHDSCLCGLDSWSFEESTYDEAVASLSPQNAWALLDLDDTSLDRADGPMTISSLWHSVNRRDGWENVKLDWAPATKTLSFRFGSCPSHWYGKAIPLSDDQIELATLISAMDPYESDDPNRLAVLSDPDVIRVTAALWGDEGDDEGDIHNDLVLQFSSYVTAALEFVTEQMKDLNSEARRTAVALAPLWTQGLDDLLATARSLTVPVAA